MFVLRCSAVVILYNTATSRPQFDNFKQTSELHQTSFTKDHAISTTFKKITELESTTIFKMQMKSTNSCNFFDGAFLISSYNLIIIIIVLTVVVKYFQKTLFAVSCVCIIISSYELKTTCLIYIIFNNHKI